MVWKQTPEGSRSSLRALAGEIGTSHQLLSFYLRQWDKWQQKEYRRKANDIRAHADAENRTMTHQEQAQVVAFERASFHFLIDSVLADVLPKWIRELREEAKRGKLSRQQMRMAKFLARRGYGREIQEILAVSS